MIDLDNLTWEKKSMEMCGQLHVPSDLTPGNSTRLGPRAGLNVTKKKKNLFATTRIETQLFSHLARSLTAISTELSRLQTQRSLNLIRLKNVS
jgi:hypothetical protein